MTDTADELLKIAKKLIKKRFTREHQGRYYVVTAAALKTTKGDIYSAINTRTYQPDLSTCAEIIAIGMAHAENPKMDIDTIVTVRGPDGYVVSPCGRCREYISDYSTNADVAVSAQNKKGYTLVKAKDLLPCKYVKHD